MTTKRTNVCCACIAVVSTLYIFYNAHTTIIELIHSDCAHECPCGGKMNVHRPRMEENRRWWWRRTLCFLNKKVYKRTVASSIETHTHKERDRDLHVYVVVMRNARAIQRPWLRNNDLCILNDKEREREREKQQQQQHNWKNCMQTVSMDRCFGHCIRAGLRLPCGYAPVTFIHRVTGPIIVTLTHRCTRTMIYTEKTSRERVCS